MKSRPCITVVIQPIGKVCVTAHSRLVTVALDSSDAMYSANAVSRLSISQCAA